MVANLLKTNTTLTSVRYAAFRALIQLATIVHLGCVRSSPFSLCGVCLCVCHTASKPKACYSTFMASSSCKKRRVAASSCCSEALAWRGASPNLLIGSEPKKKLRR